MKEIRLHEGELNVMELLWSNKALAAREDPGFICRANITKRKIQEIETKALLNQMYNGSLENFIQSYLANQKFSESERNELQKLLSGQGR